MAVADGWQKGCVVWWRLMTYSLHRHISCVHGVFCAFVEETNGFSASTSSSLLYYGSFAYLVYLAVVFVCMRVASKGSFEGKLFFISQPVNKARRVNEGKKWNNWLVLTVLLVAGRLAELQCQLQCQSGEGERWEEVVSLQSRMRNGLNADKRVSTNEWPTYLLWCWS